MSSSYEPFDRQGGAMEQQQRPDLTTSTGETLTAQKGAVGGAAPAMVYQGPGAAGQQPVGAAAAAAMPPPHYQQQQPQQYQQQQQPQETMPGVVSMQPMPSSSARVFDPTDMDPGSQLNYAAIRLYHRSGQSAMDAIHGAGSTLLGMVDNTVAQLKDNITYEDLLQTLIHENERILTKDWRLGYRQATFYDCEETPTTIVDNLPSGAAILTNKRLLLLSAQVHKGLGLESIGQKKTSRRYVLKATNSDNVHYKPLPLSNFASIEMSASAGASVTADVNPIFPCCGGCCPCFSCCCASARKRWTSVVSATNNHNTRVLKIGLLLPPWGRKCMLHLELEPTMPLSHARDFIAMLQQHPKLAA
eukprot:scpid99760/ scgid10169/ 